MKTGLIMVILYLLCLFCAAGSEDILYDFDTILKKFFPFSDSAAADSFRMDENVDADLIEAINGIPLDQVFVFYRVFVRRQLAGYVFQISEMGKEKPFDIAVSISTSGKIEQVLITCYRSTEGGGVKSRRFLAQFKGKTWKSKLRRNRDINGVTGATFASRGVIRGVRKALVVWNLMYGPGKE
ncbi:MAG: FMN-binding protein [bacterium]